MASIIFHHVHFAYPSVGGEVFEDLSLLLDTAWRTGVVGRNGQGKSTLLRLVSGQLEPTAGRLEMPVQSHLFPGGAPAPDRTTFHVVRDEAGPFGRWEREMARLLADGSEAALARYSDLHERYVSLGGYDIEARISREFDAMGLPAALLHRPFGTLSGGEQTRALIVALFLNDSTFPLIDEPTNHLDREGRARLSAYLAGKQGFLLVSHDRRFLDGAVDHVLSINRRDVRVNTGNFTQWRTHMDEELEAERRRRRRIERDVARLQASARDTRRNARSRESDKYRTGALDKGFIGHRAARQMKRARNVERRIEAELAEKRTLLKNAEKQRRLEVKTELRQEAQLMVVQNVRLHRAGRDLCRDLSFTVSPGERIAITGPNGCGKTTLLDALSGHRAPAGGSVHVPGHVKLGRAFQQPLWNRGSLREHFGARGPDETRFRQLLGVLGLDADVFERDLATCSQGELKKVDLARSMVSGADVLVWDEPLNYVDLVSREQVEAAVLRDGPTLVFVEHDQAFIDSVATRVIDMSHLQGGGGTPGR